MDFGLKNKVVLVTGSGRGLGAQIAETLQAEGATVIISDVNEANARETAAALKLDHYALNVTDSEQIKSVVDAIIAKHGRIDILVNNAGLIDLDKFLLTTEQRALDIMNVNILGIFRMCQAVIPCMMRDGGGKIVNIASASAIRGGGSPAASTLYGASKAAVVTMTTGLANEFGRKGIYINAVAPAVFETEEAMKFINSNPKFKENAMKRYPVGRFGTPSEIADAVAFLAGQRSNYMNGTTIYVDGGFNVT
jgi:NAD(P)-dependent dehydrogenase (short-subunit alcohol dehydrogenase family)